MCVDRFHIVSLFLSNPCTPSTLSKEAFVYFVCPTEIPQPPFAWKYYSKKWGRLSSVKCSPCEIDGCRCRQPNQHQPNPTIHLHGDLSFFKLSTVLYRSWHFPCHWITHSGFCFQGLSEILFSTLRLQVQALIGAVIGEIGEFYFVDLQWGCLVLLTYGVVVST